MSNQRMLEQWTKVLSTNTEQPPRIIQSLFEYVVSPCPLCFSRDVTIPQPVDGDFEIRCNDCNLNIRNTSEKDVLKRWNTR